MKLKTHPHKSDLLTMTRGELHELLAGKELSVSALCIRMEEEPKPDVVRWIWANSKFGEKSPDYSDTPPNMKITFDGETGKLKSAEVL